MLNLKEEVFKTMYTHRPATIGNPCKLLGAEIDFHYGLHSIPTVGFTARCGGKSLYYSGDTYYYPSEIRKDFVDKGFMTEERYQKLTDFNYLFNHDFIIHEGGIKPIHTPPDEVLAKLPTEVKEKLVVVHTTEDKIPKDSGLRIGKKFQGIENTVVLIQE